MHKDQDPPGSRRPGSLQEPGLCQGAATLVFPSLHDSIHLLRVTAFHICPGFLWLPAGFFHPLSISPSQAAHHFGSRRTQHAPSSLPLRYGFEQLPLC